jgi:tRNA (cmo5U34)-methyltransferase
MKRDEMFAATAARASDFEFNSEVAEVFDDMLLRSIPFYREQQYMIQEIGRKFWLDGTGVYDLGCSTGTTLIALAKEIEQCSKLVGYDSSPAMLERAKQKVAESRLATRIAVAPGDLNSDLAGLELGNASLVTMCWTLQFVRPLYRDRVIRWIFDGLVDGGVLVVTDKILTNSSPMNRFFVDFYYDFKRRNSYSTDEIQRKREALENVLIPYRVDENLEMFRRNGFEIAETFFQWYNFAGFLCVKKPSTGSSKNAGAKQSGR